MIERGKPVPLGFYSDLCGSCQLLIPILSGLAQKYIDDVSVAKINVEQEEGLAELFEVEITPTLFFMMDGRIKGKLTGMQSTAALESKIRSCLS